MTEDLHTPKTKKKYYTLIKNLKIKSNNNKQIYNFIIIVI